MRGGTHAIQVPSAFDAISDDSEDEHPVTPSTAKDGRSHNYSPTSAVVTVSSEGGPQSPEDRLRHVSSGKGFQLDVALARQRMEREIEKLRCESSPPQKRNKPQPLCYLHSFAQPNMHVPYIPSVAFECMQTRG